MSNERHAPLDPLRDYGRELWAEREAAAVNRSGTLGNGTWDNLFDWERERWTTEGNAVHRDRWLATFNAVLHGQPYHPTTLESSVVKFASAIADMIHGKLRAL